nr:S8 family serine peptidase [Elainella sp. Prado103]
MSSLRVSPLTPVGSIDSFPFEIIEQSTPDLLSYVDHVLATAKDWLINFVTETDWSDRLSIAFGTFSLQALEAITQDWLSETFSTLPQIEVRAASEINGANGAYAAATDTIYLAEEFLTQELQSSQVVVDVLLEEIGHAIDARINPIDSPGDEGAIFSTVVQRLPIDLATLQALQVEDDTVVLNLDGQIVQLEQATPGINPAFDLIGLTQLRNDSRFAGIDGSGFSVAVIDTGLDQTHPLLQPNFRAGQDFLTGSNNPIDQDGHGTHVSGTVGARNENIGVAPDVGLIGLQVFQPTPQGSFYDNSRVEQALRWVLANKDVYNIVAVNMSLGERGSSFTSPSQANGYALVDEIQALEQAGVTVVSAGGNEYFSKQSQGFSVPGIVSTLSVGAVWQDGARQNFQWRSGATDITTG